MKFRAIDTVPVAAAKAGFMQGDVIQKIDGKAVGSAETAPARTQHFVQPRSDTARQGPCSKRLGIGGDNKTTPFNAEVVAAHERVSAAVL